MKISASTTPILSKFAEGKLTLTIAIHRSMITAVTLAPNRTGQNEVAGAVLAGLVLSQTMFHSRAMCDPGTDAHAKLRV